MSSAQYRAFVVSSIIWNRQLSIRGRTSAVVVLYVHGTNHGRTPPVSNKCYSSSSSVPRSSHRDQEGYKSIGSFHSDNLQDLILASDKTYVVPTLPFKDTQHSIDGPNFLLDFKNWTFLNHGAFGAALTVGHERANAWRRYLEEQPLRYFDRDLLPHLVYTTRLLADFMNAPRSNLALIQNVTSGMNSVLTGYTREYGPSSTHVILWDTTYGSVKKMAHHLVGSTNITEIPLQSKCLDQLSNGCYRDNPDDLLLQTISDTMYHHRSRLAGKHPLVVLDHTSSNTALTFPVQRLATRVKEIMPTAIVVVDGAHGLLAQHVDISRDMTNVDIYLSNGHKWLSAPRGVAVMICRDQWKDSLLRFPAVISHGVDEPDLLSRFVWDGCRDYAAALSIPVVLEFWKQFAGTRPELRQQLKDTLRQGISTLVHHWHNGVDAPFWPGLVTLADIESNILSPMALVSLPKLFQRENNASTSTDAKRIQDFLYQQRVEVPIKCINGRLYVRVSCHVYTQPDDFDLLGQALLRMIAV